MFSSALRQLGRYLGTGEDSSAAGEAVLIQLSGGKFSKLQVDGKRVVM